MWISVVGIDFIMVYNVDNFVNKMLITFYHKNHHITGEPFPVSRYPAGSPCTMSRSQPAWPAHNVPRKNGEIPWFFCIGGMFTFIKLVAAAKCIVSVPSPWYHPKPLIIPTYSHPVITSLPQSSTSITSSIHPYKINTYTNHTLTNSLLFSNRTNQFPSKLNTLNELISFSSI